MRYHYYYRNKDNAVCDDWVEAANRDDAFKKIRASGVKPFKVEGRNPLVVSIWCLSICVVVAAVVAVLVALPADRSVRVPKTEDRAQLYGDPAVIQELARDNWAVFGDDAWYARHAIPGKVCQCDAGSDGSSLRTPTLEYQADPSSGTSAPRQLDPEQQARLVSSSEYAKMVRMIRGMKREEKEYLKAGGSLADYRQLCCERLRAEKNIYDNIANKLAALAKKEEIDYEAWDRENATLRSLGLPTVPFPE